MTKNKLRTGRRLSNKQLFERIFVHISDEDKKRFRSCKRAIGRAKNNSVGTLRMVVPNHRAAQILVKLLTHRYNGFSAHSRVFRLPNNEPKIEVVITIKPDD